MPIDMTNKKEITYIYDALCGWCYGFSEVIKAFEENYHSEYNFKVLSGGLIKGDRIGPIGEMSAYILNAIPHLEKTTGQLIGKAFIDVLKDGTRIQDSNIPARALCVFKSISSGMEIRIAHKIQQMQFVYGMDLSIAENYNEICNELGISLDEFKLKLSSPEIVQLALREFNQVAAWGINGFPAVILNRGDMLMAISRGYTSLVDLESNLRSAIAQH
jgi:putative protein-disulfide isomerase